MFMSTKLNSFFLCLNRCPSTGLNLIAGAPQTHPPLRMASELHKYAREAARSACGNIDVSHLQYCHAPGLAGHIIRVRKG